LGGKTGVKPGDKLARPVYSRQYVEAYRQCDVVVRPHIGFFDAVPNRASIRHMIHSGERAGHSSLAKCQALAV
jgi:hypothetical protein